MSLKWLGICILLLLHSVLSLEDPYQTLGLSKGASQDEIKRAFKRLSLQWHPDKNDGSPEAQAKYVEITSAYEILSDDEKRKQYEDSKRGFQYQNRGFDFGFNSFFQRTKPIVSDTVAITYENFDYMVNGEDTWVIQFYADRYPACIENAPIWEQTAKSLSDFARFGRIHIDEEQYLIRYFRIRTIPSIMVIEDKSNIQYYFGRFEVQGISDFVKRLLPNKVRLLYTESDWEKLKASQDTKLNALLFSSHMSIVSPLYKHVSVKYNHLYNFAQVAGEKLDPVLAAKFGVKSRPTIVIFANGDLENRVVVEETFTKESLMQLLDNHKFLGAPEMHNSNFFTLCGRKSVNYCGILFTSPSTSHFSKNIADLRSITRSPEIEGINFGWIDAVKYKQFVSFFGLQFRGSEKLHGMLMLDGKRRKYNLLNEEIDKDSITQWLENAKNGKIKFSDIPRDVPALVELPTHTFLETLSDWFWAIIRFFVNNFFVLIMLVFFILRVLIKER